MIIVIYLSPKHHKTKAPLSREHFIHYCETNCISVPLSKNYPHRLLPKILLQGSGTEITIFDFEMVRNVE